MTQKNDQKSNMDSAGSSMIEAAANRNSSSMDNAGDPKAQPEPPTLNTPVGAKKTKKPGATDTSEKAAMKEPVPKSTHEKEGAKAKVKAKNKSAKTKTGRGVAWLAILVALCATSGVGYLYWDIQQYRSQAQQAQKQAQLAGKQLVEHALEQAKSDGSAVQENITQVQENIAQVQGNITQVRGNITQVQGNITQTQAHTAQLEVKVTNQQRLIKDLSSRLLSTQRQVGEITNISRRSWLLAEAEYLLRLANQRLMTEQETAGALALLHSADDILVNLDEVSLYSIRTAIAGEVAALEALGNTDVEGYFLRLSALSEQVDKMSLLQPLSQDVPKIGDLDLINQSYIEVFNTLIEKLMGLVRISQRDEPIKPLLSPQQHYYVQQNLRLMLEQAQLALLQRRPELYEQRLVRAGAWVNEYFQLNTISQAFLSTLEQLRGINVAPQMPDISGSLALLKQYLASQVDEGVAASDGDV